jgi:hydrogenase assembly chaperone HypC/HupF
MSIPGRVTQLNGALAEVEQEGRTAWFNALTQPDVQVGDYVLTHANLIVAIISEEEAQCILETAREVQELLDAEASGHSAKAPTPDNSNLSRKTRVRSTRSPRE